MKADSLAKPKRVLNHGDSMTDFYVRLSDLGHYRTHWLHELLLW